MMTKTKIEWTNEHNLESFRYGWSIFCCDKGRHELHGLDDPLGACEDHGIESKQTFSGKDRDREAAEFVQKRADEGCPTCRTAIEFLIEEDSEDVALFGLKITW